MPPAPMALLPYSRIEALIKLRHFVLRSGIAYHIRRLGEATRPHPLDDLA